MKRSYIKLITAVATLWGGTGLLIALFGATNEVDNSTNLTATSNNSNCNCIEYIYLNEKTNNGAVHKYAVSSTGLSEIGSPWFDNAAQNEQLSSPHGLGIDLNGRLYIGETAAGDIRRLSCTGDVVAENDFVIADGGYNIGTIDNTLFINSKDRSPNGIYAYDMCTGNALGYICLNQLVGTSFQDWGFYIDAQENFYITDDFVSNRTNNLWKFNYAHITLNPINGNNPVCIDPFLSEGNGNLVAGEQELPRFSLYGVVTDAADNIYIVEKARRPDPNFNSSGLRERASRLLKYNANGEFIKASVWDNEDGDGGYFNAIGIVYSTVTNQLYVSTESPRDDCVAIFDLDLNYLGAGVGATGSGDAVKGISIIKECCPIANSITIDTTICSANLVGETIYLQELIGCEGSICEGQWTPTAGNSGLTYDSCNNSIVITANDACGTFTLNSDGTNSGLQCGAFSITLNVETENIAVNLNATDEEICQGIAAPPLTASVTGSSTTVDYQWQQNTAGCNADFINIAGANMAMYSPGIIVDTTYYRVLATVNGSCSSGVCQDTSTCVRLTPIQCCPSYVCLPVEVTIHRN